MTAAASALPWSWYADPEILAAEQDRVFRHAWQYVGHTGDLAAPAGWFPGRAGRVPVLVTRDAGGRLRALEAVCRHQGAAINPPAGRGATVRCAYHGWVYGLDGSLRDAPSAARKPGFDRAGHGLPELPVGTWGPLVFAAAGPEAPPLAAALGDLPDRLAAAGIDVGRLSFERRDRSRIAANWKRCVESVLDGGGDAHVVYPATTVVVSRRGTGLSIGPILPAGPEATERFVDHFTAPFTTPGAPRSQVEAGDRGAAEEFRRRLREALGGG